MVISLFEVQGITATKDHGIVPLNFKHPGRTIGSDETIEKDAIEYPLLFINDSGSLRSSFPGHCRRRYDVPEAKGLGG